MRRAARTAPGRPLASPTAARLCAGFVLVAILEWVPHASRASEQPTAWQEIVLLTVLKVQHAAASCGFRSDTGQIDDLLASAALTRDDVSHPPASAALARQITADEDAYKGDRDLACSQAWERFGPDGAPGVRDLLGR